MKPTTNCNDKKNNRFIDGVNLDCSDEVYKFDFQYIGK